MNAPFEVQIALRYLLAKRRQVFISVISLVSTLGVTVGVMALVIALAIMTGLQQELRDRILGSTAHVYVWKRGGIDDYRAEIAKLKTVPGVAGGAPALTTRGLITSATSEGFVTIKGIDPALESEVTELGRAITKGSLAAVGQTTDEAPPGILIGYDLASSLSASVGDSVTIITPQGTLSPFGMQPRQRRFQVVGVFRLGLLEFDSAYAYVSLESAGKLMGTSAVDHIELRVNDLYAAPAIADQIPQTLGADYLTNDWADLNRPLYSALWLEKIAMGIGIGLIVGVAALNIIASLVLLVMEKTRDIAILKTMGASSRSVMFIFLLQGLVIGVLGTIMGATMGVLVSRLLDKYRVINIPSDVYQITYLPFRVLPWDLTFVVLGAVVVCFVATLYPSRQAAKLDPAQALRYE
ncbi:MAG TPA: lipoprotein-releasing ABC transporter permease subunit [Vicinamibacterales bacterium]|nr:lipoprotein-releasing ABC transporter permease subunit [Vicinamibacterales bacterium]